jgi:FkbM family methyltransferase
MTQPDASLRPQKTFVSYSINYEDVLLRRLFADRLDGFFIDIGAQHPQLDNDLFGLYELGWRGINVEPNPTYFQLLQKVRGRDRNLQIVLSDVSGELITFFEVEGSGLSTCDEQQAMACAAQGYGIKRHMLRTSTLRDVLKQESPPKIDILKIDVEGFEEKVLAGNDWDSYRPSIIIVESTYPETPVRRPTKIPSNLEAVGYRRVHFDGLNDFYAEANFDTPPGAFDPPNVFDHFVRFETARLDEENKALRETLLIRENSFKSAEAYAHDLEAERQALQARLTEQEKSFRSAETYAHDLEVERNSLEKRISQLESVEEAYQEITHEHQVIRSHFDQVNRTAQAFRSIALSLLDQDVDLEEVLRVPHRKLERRPKLCPEDANQKQSLVAIDRAPFDQTIEPISLPNDQLPSEVIVEVLQQRVQVLRVANDRLLNDVRDLKQENRRLLAAVSQLQSDNFALNRALGPSFAISGELATLNAAMERLCESVKESTSSVTRGWEARSLQQVELDAASAETLRSQNALALQRVEAMERSTSWRVTKPLRFLGRLIKG